MNIPHIEGPEIMERCPSPDHWGDMIIWGYCRKCYHMISPVEEEAPMSEKEAIQVEKESHMHA